MKENLPKTILKFIFLIPFGFLISGCFGMFDSDSDKITRNYFTIWIDNERNRSLELKDNPISNTSSLIVPQYISEVGYNDRFIIVKQHPTKDFEKNYEINYNITNYYIVDISKDSMLIKDFAYGPLNKIEFDNLKIKLNIGNIEFTQKYPTDL